MNVKQVINLDIGTAGDAQSPPADGTCLITLGSVTTTRATAEVAEGVDTNLLADCVVEELQRVGESVNAAVNPGQPVEGSNPNRRDLLGVLAFAYARRLFDSEDIAERCQNEPAFQRLCNGHAPFAAELMNFRRHNRPLLETVLANVLLRASQRSQPDVPRTATPAVKRQMLCHAASRLDTARHVDTAGE